MFKEDHDFPPTKGTLKVKGSKSSCATNSIRTLLIYCIIQLVYLMFDFKNIIHLGYKSVIFIGRKIVKRENIKYHGKLYTPIVTIYNFILPPCARCTIL